MRTLKFIVDGQTIKPDPNCDFTGLIPGTDKYLQAEFDFSPAWDKCVKVVGFYSALGREYQPRILRDGKSCVIPKEALEKRVFKLKVVGKCDEYTVTTNKLAVGQNGG